MYLVCRVAGHDGLCGYIVYHHSAHPNERATSDVDPFLQDHCCSQVASGLDPDATGEVRTCGDQRPVTHL
jgi:hypothetical protein